MDARRLAVVRYLLLSMVTGVLELGAVLYASRSGLSLPAVLFLGLAYQIAALFVRPLPLKATEYRLLLCAGALAGMAAFVTMGTLAIAIAVVPTAIGLQGVRDEQLTRVRVATLPKRGARIVGFMIAAGFNRWFLLAIPVVVLCIALTDRHRERPENSRGWQRPRFNRYALLMVVHQSHYFVYAYTLLYLLVKLYSPSVLEAAAVFGIGWVTYTLAPVFLGRLRTLPVLVTGHVLVACVMLIIATHVGDRRLVTVAWIIGGLGGGTVFCIKRLASSGSTQVDELDSWENIGHVTGSACAILLASVLPSQSVFLAAGCFAIMTASISISIGNSVSAGTGTAISDHMGLAN